MRLRLPGADCSAAHYSAPHYCAAHYSAPHYCAAH